MSHLMDQLALDCQYRLAAVTRESAMKSRALNYELEFERSFSRRLERRRLDRKQWQDVILPRIRNEAAMRRYERGLLRDSATAEAQVGDCAS